MKLVAVRVQNFKCIDDSNPFRIDGITSLVGKNEAGKSALLQAFYRLNPVVGSGGYDTLLDYPRRRLSEYEERLAAGASPAPVVTTMWELEPTDVEAFEAVFGPDALTSIELTITREYGTAIKCQFQFDEKRIVQSLLEAAKLHQEERAPLEALTEVADLIEAVKRTEEKSERHSALLTRLKTVFPEGSVHEAAMKVLHARLTKFLYFSEYYRMRGQISVSDVATRKTNNQLTAADRVFLALLAMAGTSMEQVAGMAQFEPLIAKLEAVSNRLTDEIFKYWSQNRHLKVDFRADEGKSGDPPPFNQGIVFRARIENQRHRVTVGFDDRSSGFVWFFSFLVWFSQVKKEYGERLVILLDEPALTLHARAQADLLRYIRERLAPQYQVIYTTHSPFMIDPENLLGARTVEDVVDSEGNILGTKVGDDVLSTDADTVFPLQAALGYDITQTLFVGKHNLLVEGAGDLLFLTWFSQELKARGREGLDRRWRIAPAGGIDKVASFVALFGGNKLHVAVLTDFHAGDKKKVRDLTASRLLRDGHVFTADMYAGQAEADVEDMIGRANYVELVNRCYDTDAPLRLPATRAAEAPNRVLKEVEAHFATLPPEAPIFDHYGPAEFLVRNAPKVRKSLPDLDGALDRFERLFRDLNKLLPRD